MTQLEDFQQLLEGELYKEIINQKPKELYEPIRAEGLQIAETVGVFYNPITDVWARSNDTDVNYMVLAERPA